MRWSTPGPRELDLRETTRPYTVYHLHARCHLTAVVTTTEVMEQMTWGHIVVTAQRRRRGQNPVARRPDTLYDVHLLEAAGACMEKEHDPMTYDGHDSSAPAPSLPDGAERSPLPAYSEEDDVATQLVLLPRSDFKWIVQLTPLDRRMMDTAQLVTELLDGTRVHRSTLVWRGGMDDWQPIEKIGDLPISARQAATLPPTARARARMAPQRAVLISLVVAISATAVATFALSRRGAMDARGSATTTPDIARPQPTSASETAVRSLEPSERAEALPVEAALQPGEASNSALPE